MSALLAPQRRRPPERNARPGPAGQATLFAAPAAESAAEPPVASAAVAPAAEPPVASAAVAPAAEPPVASAAAPDPSPTASQRRQGPTLDDLIAGAWEGLLAGAPADCLVCGTRLVPRYSAGAGVVGGRCGGCGSVLG